MRSSYEVEGPLPAPRIFARVGPLAPRTSESVPANSGPRWERKKPMYTHVATTIALSVLALVLSACGEQGHVRVRVAALPGTYVASFQSGKEHLILRSDGTYEQSFSSPTRSSVNRGKWEPHYVLLEGTDIELLGANCSEDNPALAGSCQRNLNVHRERGKLKLALNEAADWYYDRVN